MEFEIDSVVQVGKEEVTHYEVPQELPISFNSSDSEDVPLIQRFKKIKQEKKHETSYCMQLRPKVKKKKRIKPPIVKQNKTRKTFRCKICNKYYSEAAGLNHHMQLHSDELNFACSLCNFKTKTKKYLARHVQNVHVEEEITKKCKCSVCGKMFKRECAVRQHMLTHTGEKPEKCNICGKTFAARYSLKTHMLIHTDEKPYECSFCDYSCRDSSTLRKHHEKHMGIEKYYQCSLCDRKCKSKTNLKVHVAEKHLKIDMKTFQCDQCSRKFRSLKEMGYHKKLAHGSMKAKCEFCGFVVANKYNLNSHMKRHLDLRPFKCMFKKCMKRFKAKGDLQKHMRSHDPEDQFTCSLCGRQFPRKNRLNVHLKQHKEGERYECDYCGFVFSGKIGLGIHMPSHKTEERHLYECDGCGYQAKNKPCMVEHIRIAHGTGSSELLCHICDKTLQTPRNLKDHYWNIHQIKYENAVSFSPDMIKDIIKEEPLETADIQDVEHIKAAESHHEVTNGQAIEYEGEEIKEDPDDSVENVHRLEVIQAAGGLSEDIVKTVLTTNKKKMRRIPEFVFDGVYITSSRNRPIRQEKETLGLPEKSVDKYTLSRVKKGVKSMMVEVSQLKVVRALEKSRQLYNERLKLAAKRVEAEKTKTKVLNGKKITIVNNSKNNESSGGDSTIENDDDDLSSTSDDEPISNIAKQPPRELVEDIDARSNNFSITNENLDIKDIDLNVIVKDIDLTVIEDELGNDKKGTKDSDGLSNRIKFEDDLPNIKKEEDKTAWENVENISNHEEEENGIKADIDKNLIQTESTNCLVEANDGSENVESNNNFDVGVTKNTEQNERQLRQRKAKLKHGESVEENVIQKNATDASNKMLFNLHECFVCFKLFPSKPELNEHCKEHFELCNDSTLTKCPFCDYVSKSKLALHLRKKHDIQIKLPYSTFSDKQTNESGSRFVYNLNDPVVKEIELIPSIKNLNKRAAMKLDKEKRLRNDKVVKKRKLVRKGKEWILDTEEINVKFEDYLLPELGEDDYRCLKVSKITNYVEDLKNLYQLAKKKGLEMMFPCEHCVKVCQTLSALKLHSRRHDPKAKPFKQKVWKHKLKNKPQIIEKPKKAKINIDHRNAKPEPVKNKHKCDPKLIEFYEENVRGTNIEFWQFLKIYNRLNKDKIEDFDDLKQDPRGENIQPEVKNGVNININKINQSADNIIKSSCQSPKSKKVFNKTVKMHNSTYKRVISISRKEYSNRQKLKEELRKKIRSGNR